MGGERERRRRRDREEEGEGERESIETEIICEALFFLLHI